jgi:transglutaminase/protease-like cytokinesis protein 3
MDNNATGSITATYQLSGLYSNTNYSIYLNGILDHNDTTDETGVLPSFNIALSGSTDEIKVIAQQTQQQNNNQNAISLTNGTALLSSGISVVRTEPLGSIVSLIGVLIGTFGFIKIIKRFY